jgi:hypothetical protein
MQSTIQQPPDILQLFADEIVAGHRDAYQALREVLSETAAPRNRTTPSTDQQDASDPAPQPAPGELTTAQRLALRLRAAIAMLRVRPPGEPPRTKPTIRAAQPSLSDNVESEPPSRLTAAGGRTTRLAQQLDRQQRTQPQQPTPPPPTRDTRPNTSDTQSPALGAGPTAPEPITDSEAYHYRAAAWDNVPISPKIYNRLVGWYRYAQATGTRHPINATLETLRRIKPAGCLDPDSPPG